MFVMICRSFFLGGGLVHKLCLLQNVTHQRSKCENIEVSFYVAMVCLSIGDGHKQDEFGIKAG